MSYHKLFKNLMKKTRVKAGERVIADLEDTEFSARWKELVELHCEAVKKAKDLQELNSVMEAKSTLFWADVKDHTEHGMTLGVRHDEDDNLVLVEFPDKTPDPRDVLRKMFGLQDGFRGEQSDD
jgi:hypothetical protein